MATLYTVLEVLAEGLFVHMSSTWMYMCVRFEVPIKNVTEVIDIYVAKREKHGCTFKKT